MMPHSEPVQGRRAEHRVSLVFGECRNDALIAVVEAVESVRQGVDRQVASEHAARRTERLDHGRDPWLDPLLGPIQAEDALDCRYRGAGVLATAQSLHLR